VHNASEALDYAPPQAKRIHSASRTRARDDFAAWGRNHQKRLTTRRLRRSGFTPRAVQKRVMILPLGAEIIMRAQLRTRKSSHAAIGHPLHHENRSIGEECRRVWVHEFAWNKCFTRRTTQIRWIAIAE